MSTLSIYEDFSEFTGLRHCDISDNSGEEFYHKVLNKAFVEALEQKEKLIVNLDKVDGYASSFLDEAFGNLVFDFTMEKVRKNIEIVSEQEPHWKKMIENRTYKQWEERRKKGDKPKVTANHQAWYRLHNNEFKLDVWEKPAVS